MRHLILFFATGLFFLGTAVSAQAQEAIRASMDESGTIILPDSPEPASMYEFDISQLKFADVNAAVEFFRPFNSEEAFIRPVVSNGIAVLYLRNHSDRSVDEWNAFLTERPLSLSDLKEKSAEPASINPKN